MHTIESKKLGYISKFGFCLLFFTLFSNSSVQSQETKNPRERENFDFNWQFHKGDIAMKLVVRVGQGGITDINVPVISKKDTIIDYTNAESSKALNPPDWKEVNLPHDWVVEGTFVNDNTLGSQPAGSGYLPTGIGFYRKEFEIPETDKGKKISIEFDGIFRNSTVWVNGHLLGNHQSGYTPSNYDLTDVLRYGNEGKNAIMVKVDATQPEGWWYEGAGIYRHVWIIKTDRLHVARFGTYVTTPEITDAKATVIIKTTLKNEYKTAKTITLVSNIVDKKGTVLDTKTSTQSIAPYYPVEISQEGLIQKPKLWSPKTPNLYKVLTEVVENGKVIDTYETTFGVRTFEVNKNGVFLNGNLCPVKGTCNHQDFAGIGVALPDKINYYKLKLLKEVGSNAYRCSHHSPTPELLDMCDSMGILVLDENRHLSSSEENLRDLETMLYRDRNHPSIFMWSMENEEAIQGTVMGARILETLVTTAHKIDPSRKVTAAMNHARNDGGYADVLDVVGYNYGDKQLAYVKDKKAHPNRVMFCTEGTSFVSTRGEYVNSWWPQTCSNSILWQPGWGPYPGEDWADIVKYPYLGGTFVWTGFDYRGEPTPFWWPSVSSQFGFMDVCGFPKDGYYAYKAAWGNEPVVHIFPHWNWPGKENDSIKVHCYTNCDEVELFINGKSMGKQKAEPFKKLIWPVIYKPGKLEAKGYKAGKQVTKDIVETTSAPAQVALNSDVNTLKANGCDVAVIRVAIKDEKGRVVPTADNMVKFSIEGPGKIIGTGNGNPKSHEPDKASQRLAFNGYCLVLVQSEKQTGVIRLIATSDNLKGAEVLINAE
ncbi:MAG TPA: glycoside hydrolase family 2 [Marinilabiliales bacterium]|nr:glycoside hydrolase family 2 [Marinilabiliales bacterium]HBX86966.1 glycoside hydrolase family 2 [Marinilabiliales bacterium]HBY52912.1 glycoside hydrolase family 2 [Marinilabiliales bacterium]HCC31358.1 glycoside hydrolase family 2 [Marinilabiliales bacterium]